MENGKTEICGILGKQFFLKNGKIDFFGILGNDFFWEMEKLKMLECWEKKILKNGKIKKDEFWETSCVGKWKNIKFWNFGEKNEKWKT